MEGIAQERHMAQAIENAAAPLTLQERCAYLQGASMTFLLGTLLLALFVWLPLLGLGAEALFVLGWVYLAGASSDDRRGWAWFIGSAIGATATSAAMFAFAFPTVPGASYGWFPFFFFAPYLPAVYGPFAIAHAVLFAYLSARFAILGRSRPSVMIGVGSIALAAVAIAGLICETLDMDWSGLLVLFLPIGYTLVALGASRQVRRLPISGEPGVGS